MWAPLRHRVVPQLLKPKSLRGSGVERALRPRDLGPSGCSPRLASRMSAMGHSVTSAGQHRAVFLKRRSLLWNAGLPAPWIRERPIQPIEMRGPYAGMRRRCPCNLAKSPCISPNCRERQVSFGLPAQGRKTPSGACTLSSAKRPVDCSGRCGASFIPFAAAHRRLIPLPPIFRCRFRRAWCLIRQVSPGIIL